jgi:hypothetical protein
MKLALLTVALGIGAIACSSEATAPQMAEDALTTDPACVALSTIPTNGLEISAAIEEAFEESATVTHPTLPRWTTAGVLVLENTDQFEEVRVIVAAPAIGRTIVAGPNAGGYIVIEGQSDFGAPAPLAATRAAKALYDGMTKITPVTDDSKDDGTNYDVRATSDNTIRCEHKYNHLSPAQDLGYTCTIRVASAQWNTEFRAVACP